jgi:DNA-binding NarL/FixJ family response regulator
MTDSLPPENVEYPRSVLVVEDEPLLRELIVSALQERGFQVSAAGTPVDAARMFRVVDPDGVVMDIELGGGPNGFDLAETFLAEETGVAIVFLTNLPDPRFADRTATDLPPGIAYLRKGAVRDVGSLVSAVDAAIRGAVNREMRHDRDPNRPLAALTRNQVQVLRLVAGGRTNQQIADEQGITVKAVNRTIARVFLALGIDEGLPANRRVEAARRFIHLTGSPVPPAGADGT